jgi:hypothetical protein
LRPHSAAAADLHPPGVSRPSRVRGGDVAPIRFSAPGLPFRRLPGLPCSSVHCGVLRPLARGRRRPAACDSLRLARPSRAMSRGPAFGTSRVYGQLSPTGATRRRPNYPPGLCDPSAHSDPGIRFAGRVAIRACRGDTHPATIPASAFHTLPPVYAPRNLPGLFHPGNAHGFQGLQGLPLPKSRSSLEAFPSLAVGLRAPVRARENPAPEV